MPAERLLLDTNVVVAALVEPHVHHPPSQLLFEKPRVRLCIAAHSYAEAFNTLTRRGDHAPYRRPPDEAWVSLESIAAETELVGLTSAQTFEAVRAFAAMGGIGARLYDYLIGSAAVRAGATSIVSWNVGHLRALFPNQRVETPADFMARASASSVR